MRAAFRRIKPLRLGYAPSEADQIAQAIAVAVARVRRRRTDPLPSASRDVRGVLRRDDAKVYCRGEDAYVCPISPADDPSVPGRGQDGCVAVAARFPLACEQRDGSGVMVSAGNHFRARKRELTRAQAAALKTGAQIGCGSFACVYERDGHPGQVVKITQDETDVAGLAKLQGLRFVMRLRGRPVELLANGIPTGFFALIGERLQQLPREDQNILYSLDRHHRQSLARERSVHTFGRQSYTANPRTALAMRMYCQHTRDPDRCNALANDALAIHEAAGKRGVNINDIHGGNFMHRGDGKLVLVDAGVSAAGRAAAPGLAGARSARRRKRAR